MDINRNPFKFASSTVSLNYCLLYTFTEVSQVMLAKQTIASRQDKIYHDLRLYWPHKDDYHEHSCINMCSGMLNLSKDRHGIGKRRKDFRAPVR